MAAGVRRRVAALAVVAVFAAGCAAPPAGQQIAHHLSIPRLGVERGVIIGGQPELDAGYVCLIYWLPGLWIAGHRTTHGAPFAALIAIEAGDVVYFDGVRYVVQYVTRVPQDYRPPYLGPLVLQTSAPGGGAIIAPAEPG